MPTHLVREVCVAMCRVDLLMLLFPLS